MVAACIVVLSPLAVADEALQKNDAADMCSDKNIGSCAEKLVELANVLIKDNESLSKRVAKLETDLAAYQKTSKDVVSAARNRRELTAIYITK